MGSLHRFQIFKQNWNILICSSFITFQLIWESPLGGGRASGCECGCGWVWWFQISNFQRELRYLGSLKFYHVSTDLGVPQWGGWGGWFSMGVWVGGGVSTKLKSSNRIEISWSVNSCTCTHEWWCHNRIPQGIPYAMGAAICMKLPGLYMYACAHAWGTPPNTLTESHPNPPHPNPPKGGPLKSVKSQ